MRGLVTPLLLVALATGQSAFAKQCSVSIPPTGGAKYKEANYTLWIPDGAATLRGVIMHQHGCGEPAELAGATATYDLQWRALGKRWNCALMGASLRATTACQDWCEPNNGSGDAFLHALEQFATQSGHAELTRVPWVLWGHSGGAQWVYRMFMRHSQRVLVLVLRSGPVFSDDMFTGSLDTPVLYNLGEREKGDKQFGRIWEKARQLFEARRAKGGLDTWAPDPQASHDCRFGRLLVIPYIDACLAQRFGTRTPPAPWLGNTETFGVHAMDQYNGDRTMAAWLPNEHIASLWQEFVRTGWVTDNTAPPAPSEVEGLRTAAGDIVLRWQADADLESGIKTFRIYRNGLLLPAYKGAAGDLFQRPNYHDTLDKILGEMIYTDANVPSDPAYRYTVTTVNWSDLESPKDATVTIEPGAKP
jgi:pimeloyl-ACP methyl ester carboxylesterase